jgi:hypothetical protein
MLHAMCKHGRIRTPLRAMILHASMLRRSCHWRVSAWLHQKRVELFLHVAWCLWEQRDDGTQGPPTARTPKPAAPPRFGGGSAGCGPHLSTTVHVNVPFRPTIRPRPCSSCDVIVRDIWHIARSTVLQPAIRWNGNNGCGAGTSSSS